MLSIICPTLGGNNLQTWIDYHLNLFTSKTNLEWEIIICCERPLPELNSDEKRLRFCVGSDFYDRNMQGFRAAKYDFILRIADDDFIIKFDPECISNFGEDYAGVVPKTFFSALQNSSARLSDIGIQPATSLRAEMDNDNADNRIMAYFTPPLPGDNSPFWGIYRKNVLIECYESYEFFYKKQYVASDWALMANILSKGKVARSDDWHVIRHMTPMSKTLAEKITDLGVTQKDFLVLDAMPFLPSLTFIRDFLMKDPSIIWRQLIEWNLIRYSQLTKSPEASVSSFDQLTIIRLFQEAKWKEINNTFTLTIPKL